MVEADEKRLNLTCSNLSELPEIAHHIVDFSTGFTVLLFSGELGAGKTAIIKEICKVYGVTDEVTSPTFAIINEYYSEEKGSVYHFDFYRIETVKEASDLGLEEYFYSDSLCLVEWPERIGELVPDRYIKVSIHSTGAESREYKLERHE